MSLPSAKAPPAQLSIRSFFQSKQTKYAPPPSSRETTTTTTTTMPTNSPPSAHPSPHPPVQNLRLPPLPTTLPPEAVIRPITESDIAPLRRINSLLLQVSYPDTFYQKAIDPSSSGPFSRVITWTHEGEEPKIIGGIVSHVEPDIDTSAAQVPQNLYIRSLCLLSPYRSLGLMNAALEHVIATAISAPNMDVRTVTAHVWTENEEGLHWYDARGFTRLEPPVKGYYLKLRPDSAWLMKRDVGASVRSSLPGTNGNGVAASSRPVGASTTAAVVNLPPPPASGGPPSSKSTTPPSSAPTPPPPPPPGARPKAVSGQSYQNHRPDMEWNDLPADMAPTLGALRKTGSESASATSSRSSSQAPRRKKDRSYPAAAFGN
ncbi:Acyl-CoA N-acyltransferase [Metarhizium brunneum]